MENTAQLSSGNFLTFCGIEKQLPQTNIKLQKENWIQARTRLYEVQLRGKMEYLKIWNFWLWAKIGALKEKGGSSLGFYNADIARTFKIQKLAELEQFLFHPLDFSEIHGTLKWLSEEFSVSKTGYPKTPRHSKLAIWKFSDIEKWLSEQINATKIGYP